MTTDSGMSSDEAERLAASLRRAHLADVSVELHGHFFVVHVQTDQSRWTLYDEQDWLVWQSRILRE